MYSVCFTGKAKRAGHCERCLSAAHKTEDCILPGDEDPDVPERLKAIEAAVMAIAQHGASGSGGTPSAQRATSAKVCRKYTFFGVQASSWPASLFIAVPPAGALIQPCGVPRSSRPPPLNRKGI